MNAFLVVLFLFAGLTHAADFDAANQDGKSFANSINNSSLKDLAKNVEPNDVPGYQGTDVEAKQYYGDPGIEDKARAKSATDPTAKFMNEAKASRPDFAINKKSDPLFKRYDEVTDLSHGLSGSYSGCIDLPVGTADVTKYSNKYCHVDYKQDRIDFDCTATANVTCSNANAGQPSYFNKSSFHGATADMPLTTSNNILYSFGSGRKNRRGKCKWFEDTIRFYVSDKNLVTEFNIKEALYDDWLFVYVNGNVGFQAVGGSQTVGFDKGWAYPGSYNCEQKGIRVKSMNLDAKPKLWNGWNTIKVRHLVGGGGNARIKFQIRKKHGCSKKTEFSWSCPAGESRYTGTYTGNQQCIEGAETRYIKGFPHYRSCWKYKYSYYRLTDPYPVREALCSQLMADGCGQVGTSCVSHNGEFCAKEKLKFSCPYVDSARHVSMCGDQMVCPDGGCTSDYGQTYQPQTQEFKEAATGLAVAESISDQIDHDNLTVFSGKVLRCSKRSYGAGDCCKDSGWGIDSGLNSCSSEEKELGLAKQAKKTHYVDRYCNDRDDVLGCLSRRYYYCKFPSKLARIIVEQGYPQLGKAWGNRHAPNCGGFTTEEIERLNFDKMDLSEFYADVEQDAANGSIPNVDALVHELKNKIKSQYSQVEDK